MSALIGRKLQQATAQLHAGQIASADALIAEVLRVAPRHPEALSLRGITHLMQGRVHDAIAPLQQALTVDPNHGIAGEHLGLAHLQLGQFADAERVLSHVARLPRAPASVFMRLGAAILNQQRPADALPLLQRALTLAPDDADCLLNLGQTHAQLGQTALAEAQFHAVLRRFPKHADALFNLGVLALNADRLDEAKQWFVRAVDSEPRHTDAMVNLGVVLQRLGQAEDADAQFQRALTLTPDHAAALSSLAQSLAVQGRYAEARQRYELTLQANPQLAAAREGLGTLCLSLGRMQEAAQHFRELVHLEPANATAQARYAEALFQLQQFDQAEAAALRTIAMDAGNVSAHTTLVDIYFVRNDVERARTAIRSAVAQTGSTLLLGMLARELKRTCDWQEWADCWQKLSAEMAAGGAVSSPFSLLYQPTTPREQLDYTQRWCAARFRTARAAALPTDGLSIVPVVEPRRRQRIGYLSSDLHKHAVAYLIVEVLEQHDRNKVEIFAFSFGPEDYSPIRERIRNSCEHFIDIAIEPDDIAANRIRDANLDIIVDLKGHTLGSRTALLQNQLAPVQLNWLGYPGTMGAPFIDGIIADEFIIPPAAEEFYAERVLRMPHCYQPTDSKRVSAAPLARAAYGLPDASFVFCCFNQAFKISAEIFACWSRLLQRIPGSVLWLLQDNPRATDNLQKALASAGLPQARMIIAPRAPQAEHLARYQAADLALDTFPYTSHTTASDALWSECPLLGLCGDTFAARVSGSILSTCGLADLITYTLADYEAMAFHLATDRVAFDAIRQRVVTAKQNSPLFDSARFARDLEELYANISASH